MYDDTLNVEVEFEGDVVLQIVELCDTAGGQTLAQVVVELVEYALEGRPGGAL